MKKSLIVVLAWFLGGLSAHGQTLRQYWAQVDANGVVLRVIVADHAFINSGAVGDPSRWVQTHKNGAERKNYAGVGYTYHPASNAFIPPKPYSSWRLNETTARWEAPRAMPETGGPWHWNELAGEWVPQDGERAVGK